MRDKNSRPYVWRNQLIYFFLVNSEQESKIQQMVVDAINYSIDTWNNDLARCRSPRFLLSPRRLKSPSYSHNSRNEITFDRLAWEPKTGMYGRHCASSRNHSSIRLYEDKATSTWGGKSRRVFIHEVDININTVDWKWSLTGNKADMMNLRAALMHQMGHVLGLGHTCSLHCPLLKNSTHFCKQPLLTSSIMNPLAPELFVAVDPLPSDSEISAICKMYK